MNPTAIQVMDLTSLKAVVSDLRKNILPSRFEKAQQLDAGTLQIGLRTLKGLAWIELSWGANAPRLVQIPPPAKQTGSSTLAKQLQHGLRNLALISLQQKGFERVVEFGLAGRPGESCTRFLVLELMGRHSNLLLLDQSRKVIAIGRQVREHQSRIRPISTGDLYSPPPPLEGVEPSSKESFDSWKKRLLVLPLSLKKSLQSSYQGISPAIALQLAGNQIKEAQQLLDLPVGQIPDEVWKIFYQRWCIWLKALQEENFCFTDSGPTTFQTWSLNNSKPITGEQLSLSLGKYYRNILDKNKVNTLINEIKSQLLRFKEKEEKLLINQRVLLNKTFDDEIIQKEADEILCLKDISSEMICKAQGLYQKAKKLRRSKSILHERIDHHSNRIKSIEESNLFLENLISYQWEDLSEKIERLFELKEELTEFLKLPKRSFTRKNEQNNNAPKPLVLTSPNGLIIEIGRNHRQNDWISIVKSRKGDFWFHAQESPGSHIMLKSSTTIPEEEDIQMAADLAAFFSRAKGNNQVSVFMVEADQLKRVPGAIKGTVSFRKSKILWGIPLKGMEHLRTYNSKI